MGNEIRSRLIGDPPRRRETQDFASQKVVSLGGAIVPARKRLNSNTNFVAGLWHPNLLLAFLKYV